MTEYSNFKEMIIPYITPAQLERYLKILTKIEIILIAKEDSWLRIAVSNQQQNGTECFSIDNGAGDCATIYINGNTSFIKGFDHENDLSPYQQEDDGETVLKQIYCHAPMEFMQLLEDESRYETTFAMWNLDGGDCWHFNNISYNNDGGREYLLEYIHTSPQSLIEWAEEYHDVSLDFDIVSSIYEGKNITEKMIAALNPSRDIKEALEELAEIDKLI